MQVGDPMQIVMSILRMLRRLIPVAAMALIVCAARLPVAFSASSDAAPSGPQRLQALGAGDSISVQVYGQPDMTGTVYVNDDGTISLPLVGSIKVVGLTAVQAAARVADALKKGQFLVDPHVTIDIVQGRSQRVSIIGEVRTPGRYAIDPNTTIIDLLAQAGGPTENSGDIAYVERTDAQGNVARHSINLHALSGSEGTAQPQMVLQGGDSIIIPKAETFYVYGEVAMPNMYRLENGMTVIQAISRAGGVTARGSDSRIDVKRSGPNGKYVTKRVNASDLVQANDVIYVRERIF
jgi:polysaccharide biosynthesis/export protein